MNQTKYSDALSVLIYIYLIMKQEQPSMKDQLLSESDSDQFEQVPPPLHFFGQAALMINKNFILTFKNPKNLIFLIVTPFLLSLFMAVFGSLASDNGQRVLADPPIRPTPVFTECIGKNCISLQYAFITTSAATQVPLWINHTIQFFKKQTNLSDSTIQAYQKPIVQFQDLQAYYKTFNDKPNRTQIAVIFCGDGVPEQANLLNYFCDGSKDFGYYLVMNRTDSLSVIFHDLLQPLPIDEDATALKLLIDNAILDFSLDKSFKTRMEITTSQFPVAPNRFLQNYDIITEIGAFYYMITPLFAFLFIQSQIVREKQYRLRQGLNIFGASHFAYWISWFVIANIYAIIAAISTYLAGLAFGFGFYRDTPFYIIIFFLMYPFTLAMQMLAFFLSTLSPTLKAANAISYGIVLFAIVVQSFVANNNLLVFLFSEDPNGLVQFLKTFLLFYPPFSYTKIFTNITQYSGFHFNMITRKWEPGAESYNMSIFSNDITGVLPFGGGKFDRYSDLQSMAYLFMDVAFFIVLAWYFDHVSESNRGRSQSPFFPFIKIKNLIVGKKERTHTVIPQALDQLKNPNFLLKDQEQSTIKERQRVYRNAAANLPAMGLRIKDLSKTFSSMCSKNRVQAVSQFNLEIQPNQLMGILGHNGAGKTTLINILTGVISPDKTKDLQIIINNKSIDNIDEIRKYIGVCSQFDILWNQMTAYQHLYMFARLKNIPKNLIDQKIDNILRFVNLLPQKNNRISSYSGGMKRRMSLAISAIGNPKIILLDQPTTGLDPKVRQQIWQLIERLKKGKSILLTTHSMEQADILADRLSVMVKGKLKCVGTSFYLKQKYGDGHRITLNVDNSKSKEVFKTIKKLFPKAIQVDYKGGNMIIGMSDFQNLLDLVKMLENKQSSGLDEYTLKQSIKDWNVSHSTLEQVFMKVTKQEEQEA